MPRSAWLGILVLSLNVSTAWAAAGELHPTILDSWGVHGPNDELWALRAVSVDSDGNVFLIDQDWLHKFTNDGTILYRIGQNKVGHLLKPRGVATDNDGNVYVTALSTLKFNNNGDLLLSWGVNCTSYGLSVHESNLFIRCDGKILKYTLEGELLAEWPMDGAGDVATDQHGNVFVGHHGQLFKFRPDGTSIGLEDYGFGEDGFISAYGIAVDANGLIYVASGGQRIKVYDHNGIYRAWWDGHAGAYGIAIDNVGNIYVTDAGHPNGPKLVKYAPITTLPPPTPPPEAFLGTAMLHLEEAKDPQGKCNRNLDSASSIVTLGEARADGSARYFAYLLASPNSYDEGLAGVQLGIDYDEGETSGVGLRVHSWSSCSNLEWPDDHWPAPGSGNTMTWDPIDDCMQDPLVVAGYFYLTAYSPALMSIVGFPHNTGLVKTADCLSAESVLRQALGLDKIGWISLGGAAKGGDSDGCNPALEPCNQGPTLVLPTTWGQIKARYGN